MRYLIVLWVFAASLCPAEEVHGFLRVANAVTKGTGALRVFIDGKEANPRGYRPGDVTGGIALAPGTRTVTFTRDGLENGKLDVRLKENETMILIPFAEEIPVMPGQPPRRAIRVLRLRHFSENDKRTLSFVSVSRQEETKVEFLQGGKTWESSLVRRLGIARGVIRQERGYLPVRHAGNRLAVLPVAPDGNHVVVIYDQENGKPAATTFLDYRYGKEVPEQGNPGSSE